ncbi:putative hydrolase [Saccharothrix violaceirubra]|uniref:Putative hydrolase n=1 Tax=Saccharothrix violaceirubra TaxID=413306 RepID=A0A7W7T196_9PSEU|nr:putative hydrolase [Saccharothrix violaceirubra]
MAVDAGEALRTVAFRLERVGEPGHRVKAFRRAAGVVDELGVDEVARQVARGTLTDVPGIGPTTARVVADALAGREIGYLDGIVEPDYLDPAFGGHALRELLTGDCHTHSDWSDGGSPILEMATTARSLGHRWMVLTDHSPRLRVANGLSAERLRRQLDVVAALNVDLAPFRILTGIEVDILDDGSLDQDPELLDRLDFVVASVHSTLRMPAGEMTRRMVAAVRDPLVDVLGHCTGRRVAGKVRAESAFDARTVFTACRDHGTAVEINSRPDRLDPPRRLLSLAVELGCSFTIDSDAHAPGQLDWLHYGCRRAEECGVDPSSVLNTVSAEALTAR